MCNLNIIVKHKDWFKETEQTAKNMTSFLIGATSHSFINNSDGDGVYFNTDTLIKGREKLNFIEMEKHVQHSGLILSHQRLSTSGHEDKFIQPFMNDEFVLAHNGVLSSYAHNNKSDTFNLFRRFTGVFDSGKGDREQRIVKAIQTCVESIYYGSYSIALYDKKDRKLYYFKNPNSSINVYRYKSMFYFTTDYDNVKLATQICDDEKEWIEMEIENYHIYMIDLDECLNLYDVGTIKENYNYGGYRSYNKYDGIWQEWDYEEQKEEARECGFIDDVHEVTDIHANMKCSLCDGHTTLYDNYEDVPMCVRCMKEATEKAKLKWDIIDEWSRDLIMDIHWDYELEKVIVNEIIPTKRLAKYVEESEIEEE